MQHLSKVGTLIGSTTVFAYFRFFLSYFPLTCSVWRNFTALTLHVCSPCTFISNKKSSMFKWQLQTFLAILSFIFVLDIILTTTLVSSYQGSTCRFDISSCAKVILHNVNKVMTYRRFFWKNKKCFTFSECPASAVKHVCHTHAQ